jgi:hypothetical protein
VVERGPYDLRFGERKAPDGTGRRVVGIYAGLLCAEPDASRERKLEPRAEAERRSICGRLLAAEPHATS